MDSISILYRLSLARVRGKTIGSRNGTHPQPPKSPGAIYLPEIKLRSTEDARLRKQSGVTTTIIQTGRWVIISFGFVKKFYFWEVIIHGNFKRFFF